MNRSPGEAPKRNVPASIHARLLALKRGPGEDFRYVLVRYGVERLLYRLSISPYTTQFILKGAMLLATWKDIPHRPTLDLDLLGHGDPDVDVVASVFRELARAPAGDDGLAFDPGSARAEVIREEGIYQGVRVRLQARLGEAVIPLQIDVGFGDSVAPGPVEVDYPSLLGFPAARLRAYPPETVVAEKLESLVALGMKNSRMKDIYDLWIISRLMPFSYGRLRKAVASTFQARGTALPAWPPVAFTPDFSHDEGKQQMWRAFLARSRLEAPDSLDDVLHDVAAFVQPVEDQVGRPGWRWPPGGPWQDRGSE